MTPIPPIDPALPSEPVRFTGRAGEWFGIWIVNLLLSIITIGIFSAWAKVRAFKYFYGNTSIGGRAFDYHATGMQILLGRLIVIAAIVVVSIIAAFVPPAIILLYIGLAFGIPWLVIRATQFQARNTSWSNVRFNFEGRYWDAFITFVLLPIGVAFTFYLTLPFLSRRVNRFVIDGHSLGNNTFRFASPIGGFYLAFALAAAWTIAALVLFGVLFGVTLFSAIQIGDPTDPMLTLLPVLILYGLIFVGFLPAAVLYGAMTRNFVYAHTELQGGHRFTSTVSPWRMLWIVVSNVVVVIFTLGLMLPWTQIRLTRYLADNSFVRPNGSLDEFAGKAAEGGNAIGDAFGDIEGFDIGAAGI